MIVGHYADTFVVGSYRLATVHSVTDRQTDDSMMPIADILSSVIN